MVFLFLFQFLIIHCYTLIVYVIINLKYSTLFNPLNCSKIFFSVCGSTKTALFLCLQSHCLKFHFIAPGVSPMQVQFRGQPTIWKEVSPPPGVSLTPFLSSRMPTDPRLSLDFVACWHPFDIDWAEWLKLVLEKQDAALGSNPGSSGSWTLFLFLLNTYLSYVPFFSIEFNVDQS